MVMPYNMNTNPLIHIGYPKTGTTWFQKNLYPNAANCYFMSRSDLIKYIISPTVFDFDPCLARNQISSIIGSKRLVICDELILGGLDIGFGIGEFIYIIANRLRLLFPSAQIIIFIRNQIDILESAYSQYIKAGGTYNVDKYLRFSKIQFQPYVEHQRFNPVLFDYAKVINFYTALFSKENIRVYLFEKFEENPTSFIDMFCQKTDIKIVNEIDFTRKNVRLSFVSTKIVRLLNHFHAGHIYYKNYWFHIKGMWRVILILCKLTNKIGKPYSFNKKQKESIVNFYTSNSILDSWVSLSDLKAFNYRR